MSAFHVYVESPVDRSPEGIERLAIAISKKYGLPVPDLIKRMTAGRFRVKANIDAATADTYVRALEEVGARVKVEEAHPTQPSLPIAAPASAAKSGPIPAAARPPAPPVPPEPPTKAPTQLADKPSRGGRYSVSPPPSSSRTALPGAQRAKTPSSGPGIPPASGPPREAHGRSQLMPPSRVPSPSVPPLASAEIDPFGDLELSVPTGTGRPSSSSLPPANVARPATSSLPPATTSRPATSSLPPATARPATSSLPPSTERSGSSSLLPASTSPPAGAPRASNQAYQSGLSAAYSQEIHVTSDLGALGEDALSLSSLDGVDDAGGGDVSFDAPSPGMPASIGPPPEPASPVKFAPSPNSAPVVARTMTPAPIDMFAPPDAEEAEQIVNLAPTEARPQLKPGQSPPLGVPLRKAPVSQGVAMGGVAVPEMPRTRIVAGVVLAILIGFLPAHLIASTRESSAFKKIDDQIIATQSAADTPEMYATLDAFREAQLERKESERRSIALTSMLIWAVIAAGVGYVWFRRIPWDRTPRG